MTRFRPLSNVEQLVAYFRDEIMCGRLEGSMPGVNRLVKELGVGTKTVLAAMEELERERLLEKAASPKPRRIVRPKSAGAPVRYRIRILAYERSDSRREFLVELRHQLQEVGHDTAFADGTLIDLGMDVRRVARLVEKTPADAWVVIAGSREVLEWFAARPVPAFALFGHRMEVPIASTGPNKSPAFAAIVDRLVELGHRRIVMMVGEDRRKPEPGFIERAFLAAMEARGIPTGPYHLPDWGNEMKGFHRWLDVLFRHTPPTALLLDEPGRYVAAQQHLALRGIVAPRDVSMLCLDPDSAFAWCDPPVSHIDYDSRQWVRRVVRWAENVAKGRNDHRNVSTSAKFVEGGTIGPAPK